MKAISVTALVLLALVLTACGGSSKSSNPAPRGVDGFWTINLHNPDGSLALVFNANLTQAGGSSLNISNFSVFTPSPCFTSSTSQSATFTVTGASGGFQTGPFTMTVSTIFGTAVENVATLTGTREPDGRISGTWTLTGLSGCNGTGTLLMMLPE